MAAANPLPERRDSAAELDSSIRNGEKVTGVGAAGTSELVADDRPDFPLEELSQLAGKVAETHAATRLQIFQDDSLVRTLRLPRYLGKNRINKPFCRGTLGK